MIIEFYELLLIDNVKNAVCLCNSVFRIVITDLNFKQLLFLDSFMIQDWSLRFAIFINIGKLLEILLLWSYLWYRLDLRFSMDLIIVVILIFGNLIESFNLINLFNFGIMAADAHARDAYIFMWASWLIGFLRWDIIVDFFNLQFRLMLWHSIMQTLKILIFLLDFFLYVIHDFFLGLKLMLFLVVQIFLVH